MPIASIGVTLRVTPADDLQILRGHGDYEFVYDRSAFKVRVSEILWENGVLIGVSGPVIEGHSRYQGMIATLLTRMDDSHWERDVHSGVNFYVGKKVAHRVNDLPHGHPESRRIDEYPFMVRYGSVDVEGEGGKGECGW